jgi:hypothetical protein
LENLVSVPGRFWSIALAYRERDKMQTVMIAVFGRQYSPYAVASISEYKSKGRLNQQAPLLVNS